MKVSEALLYCSNSLKAVSDSYRLESLLILSYVLNTTKENVYRIDQESLNETQIDLLNEIIKKRKQRYPLPYILKNREFMGLNFYIEEGVLIPRQETETLVEIALEKAKDNSIFLDIGSGSGVIAISLLHFKESISSVAVDILDKAIEITRINAIKHGVFNRLNIFKADFKELKFNDYFDFILSNPPYVKTENLKNLPYEPLIALDGGEDGFKFYPKLIEKSYEMLKKDGFVIFEIDPEILDAVLKEMAKFFTDIEVFKDLGGFERFVFGVKDEGRF